MKITLFAALAALSLAARGQQAITPDVLAQLQDRPTTADDRFRRNAISAVPLKKMSLNTEHNGAVDQHFSLEVKNTGVTDQQSSGRCWLFTGTNVLRHKAARRLGLKDFMFSHDYLFFYDQLEKSNLFLQAIIDTRHKELDDPQVQWLLSNPLSDGGTYTGVADLVMKYGLVPKDVMPETYAANNTSEFSSVMKTKLREIAIALRERAAEGLSEKKLEAQKVEGLKTVYHMLTLAYGVPPKSFQWAPERDGRAIGEKKTYTPLEFYKAVAGGDEDLYADYVMLMNDPSRPYNKVYEIDYDRHVYDGHNWLYLNLPLSDLKPLCIASLRDSVQMYFSCDVGKQLNRQTGLLDLDNYDYESLFATTFPMTKRQRIQTHDSGSTHAMTLMAVDLDSEGRPTKWKVENSWGPSFGFAGHLIMTDRWFDEYMFRVVVKRKYLTPAMEEMMKQKPVRLPAWDPMFMGEE